MFGGSVKTKLVLLTVVWVMAAFTAVEMLGNIQEEPDDDSFGKIIVQILNPESGNAIDEVFNIGFYDYQSKNLKRPMIHTAQTDEHGFFSGEIVEGKYYVWAGPASKKTYTWEPYSFYTNQGPGCNINVVKGKITKVFKKAFYGGNLKIILLEPSGQKLDVENVLGNQKFDVSIEHLESNTELFETSKMNPSTDKREFLFKNVSSGHYSIKFSSSSNVVGDKVKGIIVEAKKTTEYNYIIHTNTGVEGIVKNENGLPVEDVHIVIRGKQGLNIYASTFSNGDGYYKIIGLKEGNYEMHYSIDVLNTFYSGDINHFEVVSGKMTTQNITFRKTEIK